MILRFDSNFDLLVSFVVGFCDLVHLLQFLGHPCCLLVCKSLCHNI